MNKQFYFLLSNRIPSDQNALARAKKYCNLKFLQLVQVIMYSISFWLSFYKMMKEVGRYLALNTFAHNEKGNSWHAHVQHHRTSSLRVCTTRTLIRTSLSLAGNVFQQDFCNTNPTTPFYHSAREENPTHIFVICVCERLSVDDDDLMIT